ncbi:hypothetical protein OIU77_019872 [Salix suchowensis]|uniref:Uncharacterized protein n=1 Tax=Salix suchowensis TaxID=1278906 RepID=A0ABQ9CL79_9ROSI|nr:hypothetical protein OIU77_019872 [Salix suchowensis]
MFLKLIAMETEGGLNKWASTNIPSLANAFPTWRAKPAPKECPATHTLLLPYISATDLNASNATLNLTEPFKLSQARKRRSSSISLRIVGPLSIVPRSAKTAFGAPLGLIKTMSANAAVRSHSSTAPNIEPSLSSVKVWVSLYLKLRHQFGARAFSSVLFSCLSSSSK